MYFSLLLALCLKNGGFEQKRARAGKLNGGDNQDRRSEPSDQSPNEPDRDDSLDDFEEVRPKTRRRAAVDTAADAISDLTLIGNFI